MKLTVEFKVNLKVPEVTKATLKANQLAMRDTVVDIQGDSIKNAKAVGAWLTGHNARSIASEVSGMGVVKQGTDAEPDRVVDDGKLEGAVFSTSGYGGFLETGTVRMPPRPYMKPAMDKNFTEQKFGSKVKGYLK